MPIYRMTDKGIQLPQIGKIHKGEPKGDGRPGKDLPYFRVELDDAEAKKMFAQAYADSKGKPDTLRVFFPFNDVDRVWSAYLEAYTANRLVARSDGLRVLWWKNGRDVFVQDGRAAVTREVKIWRQDKAKQVYPLTVDLQEGQPVPYTEGMVFQRTEKTLITAKPVGRLRVILPELNRWAVLLLTTTSSYDITALGGPDSGELGAINSFCHLIDRPLALTPILLQRKPQRVPYIKEDGSNASQVRYLLHVETDPEFAMMAIRQSMSMPLITAGPGYQTDLIVDGDEPQESPRMSELRSMIKDDTATAYWSLVSDLGLDRPAGTQVLKECGGDLVGAFEKLVSQYQEVLP